ncbi:MAG TPA: HEAT repeat domain-containing protein [Acidimicrobiales bacterium]|nr:HEAT repeat domain-containing protein [Acidimicrobiales bacterium]
MLAGHAGDADGAAQLLEDPDPSVRAAAIGALARVGELGRAALEIGVADPEPSVRRRTCEELGRALGRPSVPAGVPDTGQCVALVLPLLDDHEPAVVESAAWALGEAGARDDAVVERLTLLARSHNAPLCREAAVAALGALGDRRGLGAVLAALDDKPAVRRRAAVALAAFDDPLADAGLRRCLEDKDWQVRQAAEDLLRQP